MPLPFHAVSGLRGTNGRVMEQVACQYAILDMELQLNLGIMKSMGA